jgi:cytochrome c peroxidase
MQKRILVVLGAAALIALAAWGATILLTDNTAWTDANIKTLRSLSIGELPPLPPDPSNRYADNAQAALLGQKLFFDTRFSANGKVACATCHLPGKAFQDGLPLAQGVGTTTRRTMSIIGTAYSPWLFWDGRKDSQWSQALGPMESAVEHGGSRTQYAHLIAQYYRVEYEALFGPLPDLSSLPASAGPVADPQIHAAWDKLTPSEQDEVSRIYANMGKAIAAYERQLNPGPARFDSYVQAVLSKDTKGMQSILSTDEIAGLRLFIGKANCTQCHNGSLFTDNHFHNTGVPAVASLPEDVGRLTGAAQVQKDEFNCLGKYSDADPSACSELKFMISSGDELRRAYRPPSLRGVADRPPYMHAGQFATLVDVLRHYSTAPASPAGHSEIHPLALSETEQSQLIAFLRTLSASVNTDPKWLQMPQ